MTEKQYLIWFASINILPIKKVNILRKFEKIEKVYSLNSNDLLKVEDINFLDIMEIEKSKKIDLIIKYEKFINKNEIRVISINDKEYPEKLKNIYDPPIVIFAKGNIELLKERAIAVIGSRDTDEYGKKQAYGFSYALSQNKIVIVSGLAKGVDGMAHLRSIKCKR